MQAFCRVFSPQPKATKAMAWLPGVDEDDTLQWQVPSWRQNIESGKLDLDLLPPFRDWPLWAKNMATLSSRKRGEHLKNRERFQLWHFFVRNGTAPEIASGAVIAMTHTDRQARNQMRELARNSEYWINKFRFARVYDVQLKRPTDLAGNS